MLVAEYLINECKALNPDIFLFVGGGNMYLTDAIGRSGISYHCMHHEQALAMAAEGYARITGKPSVCVVTTGPGGTNTLTGLYGAWVDSIPIIFISGQVRTEVMTRNRSTRQIAEQEVNIVDVVKPLTKFAATCFEPQAIASLWKTAVHMAATKRPGPVWLDVPLDVQCAEYHDMAIVESAVLKGPSKGRDILQLLREAQYPVILAGNGIRLAHAEELFGKIMDQLHIPTIPDFNARDLGPFQYPTFGLQGHPGCNQIIDKADLILILGCRMNIRQIGWNLGKFGKKATKIMVDIDQGELYKHTFQPDIRIREDLLNFLTDMEAVLQPYTNMWAEAPRLEDKPRSPDAVSPYTLIQELNKRTKPNDVVVLAGGSYPTVAVQRLQIKPGMRLLMNSGCGAMGYELPAAIGAAIASKRHIICLAGDGSLQLNIQELQTLKQYQLPITVFVGNNNGYGSIRATQDHYFNGFYVGADPTSGITFPDLEKVVQAYGIEYRYLHDDWQLGEELPYILSSRTPIICELNLDPTFRLEKTEI